jgi:CHAT domain-containing protein/tetratricopeptide (TPR) repeat protein
MKNSFTLAAVINILLLSLSQALLPCPNRSSSRINSFSQEEYSEYFNQGERSRIQGDYEEAIEFFTKALSLSRKNKETRAEIEALIKLGLLYWNTGRPDDSVDFYKKAQALAENERDEEKKEEIREYIQIYDFYQAGKEYRDDYSPAKHQKSIESFEKAIALAREIQSKEHELKCLRQLSIAYSELNDLDKFLSLNHTAREIALQINHKQEEGRCLFNIGYYYDEMEDYSQALRDYTEALRIARIVEDYNYESMCLTNISIIYWDLGNYDKALEFLRDVLRIDREVLEDDAYVAQDLNSIGVTYQKKALQSGNVEDFYNALTNYEESLKIARRIKETEIEIEALNNMGFVSIDLERYPEALKYFTQALKKAEENEDDEETANILINIGIVYSRQENYDQAIQHCQRAIETASRTGIGYHLWEAHFEIANAYMKKGDYQNSLKNFKRSIDHLESIRSSIILEELKASYLGTDKRLEAYQNTIDLLVKMSRLEPEKLYDSKAFHFLERAKARVFLERLGVFQANITRGVDRELLDEEEKLFSEISSLNSELLKPGLRPEQEKDIMDKLSQSEDRLKALKRKIRMSSPAYANLKYPQIISLEETQKHMLDSRTAFFEYSLGEINSYAFVITKRNLKIFPLPSTEKIRSQVKDYLAAIADRENNDFRLGHELFKTLVSPGLDGKFKKIIFIPDGILHYLPFETLLIQEDSRRWLIKDYKIAYAPSISSFREIIEREGARRQKAQKDLLAFGDPYFGPDEERSDAGDKLKNAPSEISSQFARLQYSGLEIEKISSLFKEQAIDVFKRNEATEEQLKKLDLMPYRILHFATHCIIDDNKPARSHIVFSVGNISAEDEILQTREIFNLELNSDLVTLSACQTGLGQFIRGEGIVGLSRAFFHAGASSAIISLWAVHDQATSQFMGRYYHHLRSSNSIMDALQKTKLEMIDSGVLSHPYYWAAFVVTGNSDKIIYASVFKKVILLAALLLVVGITTFLFLKKRIRHK